MTAPIDIIVQMYAGDDVVVNVQITDPDGNVIDYDEYDSWACQWRRNELDSQAIPAVVSNDGSFIQISFSHAQTRAMKYDGVIDLQSTEQGKIRTWFKAKAKYVRDVTR